MAFATPTRKRIFLPSLFGALLLAGAFFFFHTSPARAAVRISDGSVRGLWHLTADLNDSSTVNTLNLTAGSAYHASGTVWSGLGQSVQVGGLYDYHSSNQINVGSSGENWSNGTINAFVYIHSIVAGSRIFSPYDKDPLVMVFDGGGTGTMRCQYYNASTTLYQNLSSYALSLNTPYMLTCEVNGSSLDLYINGTLNATTSITNNGFRNGSSHVGLDGSGGSAIPDVVLNEVMITNNAVPSSTLSQIYNSGNGSPVCVTTGCGSTPTVSITSGTLQQFQQYRSNVTSTLSKGSSTAQGNVWGSIGFGATLQSTGTSTIQLQVEVEPATTTFTGTATVSSGYVSSGNSTTTTEQNLSPGAYHWQARANDGNNNTSTWQTFGPNATGTDFLVLQATSSAGGIETTSSLQVLYHFNAQNLNDSSTYARNGTQGSTAVTFTTSTKLGAYAMSTNGGAGTFYASSTTMNVSGDFTIGFWIYPKVSLGGGTYLIYKDTPSQNDNTGVSYSVSCTANHLEFIHNGVCDNNFAYTLPTSTWSWILVERQGSNQDFYVNDQLQNTATVSSTANNNQNVYFDGEVTGTGKADMLYDEVFSTTSAISTSTRDALWDNSLGQEICITVGCQHFLLNEELYVPSVHNGQILYNASTTYSDALAKAVNTWNAQSKISFASTTATSTDVLKVFDVNRSDNDGLVDWSTVAGMWRPKSFFASSTDNLIFNTYKLAGLDPSSTQYVATHELGHAQGLAHSFYGNIMYPFVNTQTTLGSQDTTDYSYLYP